MFQLVQYVGVVFGAILLFFLDGVDNTYSTVFCLLLILLVGVPHGAVDHKIHRSTSDQRSLVRYVITYLLIAAGYTLWWLVDPAKALFIFFVLSAYHFGQELLEDIAVKNRQLIHSLLWGSIILIAPIFFDPQEIDPYFSLVTGFSISSGIPIQSGYIALLIYLIMLIYLTYYYIKNEIDFAQVVKLLSFVAINSILHLLLDFVLAFTLYFVFFHSFNAFKHQYQWLSARSKNYHFKQFVKDLAKFSSAAILGIILLLWLIKPESQASLILLFFILISVITLPHAITLDQFYKYRSQS